MGFTRPRAGPDGITRYQALYDDAKGHRRSEGTFTTEKAADRAWQRAETRMAEGRMGNPSPAAKVPHLCQTGMAAQPSDGSPHPGNLQLLPRPPHPAVVRRDADG
jgi:hypothetical protein